MRAVVQGWKTTGKKILRIRHFCLFDKKQQQKKKNQRTSSLQKETRGHSKFHLLTGLTWILSKSNFSEYIYLFCYPCSFIILEIFFATRWCALKPSQYLIFLKLSLIFFSRFKKSAFCSVLQTN